MTRVDRDKADELFITVDGEEYRQSYILDAASLVDVDLTRFDIADAKNEPGFDNSYDFVLDSNGYVIAIRPAEEVVTNYALVVDSAWTLNALDRSGQVKILMTDGTVKTYSINWKNSAKAMEDINTVETTNDVKGKPNDEKLETYLGTRDVNKPGQPGQPGQTYNKTGVAAGSIITYTLSDDDVLTIKHVLQGNTLKGNDSEIDSSVNTSSTAGVADNGTVIRMNTSVDQSLQYTAPNGYTGGRGSITVKAGAEDAKTYAVDKNTVAFYYWTNAKGETEYGVATGWDHMSDVANNTEVQVYPTLDKTSYKTYEATDLADVILFEAEAKATSANYMLVLSANAIGKDLLELNVVFEDGTVKTYSINWKNSAKAMEDINTVETTNDVKGKPNDEKLETYLGTRDVNKPGQPGQPGQTYNKTGVAAGSIITYTLSDDDVLTIKHVLQGNTLKGNDSEIDSSVNTSSTAGVADNGTVIRMNTSVDQSLQYTAPNGYTGGRGSITVKAGAEDAKTYAVDKNTVAFYYWTNAKGETEYGVATGWDHMSDVANNTEVQVYPTLDKTSYKTYEATDLADVILFEAEAKATSANYMLVLSANAIGKDLLELNVVFEDGTV
ncbi:hypothetical protein, partial [Flavonifractor plautii]|uniref:hypothetical protein n=1 Tax=Flavonifractor plautii TaxID=292800 RepID=UPI00232EB8A3